MNGNLLYRLIAFIVFALLLGISISLYVRNERLGHAIEVMAKVSEAQATRFDAALGRAESKIDTTGELIKALAKNIPEDIRRDLDERNAEIISITRARFGGSSAGGGRASIVSAPTEDRRSGEVRSVEAKVEGSPAETLSVCNRGPFIWGLKDWRLDGTLTSMCGEPGDFKYKLTQKFELVEASGDDGSHYLKLYELDPEGKHFGEALHTESFVVIERAKAVEKFFVWAPHLDIAGGINHEARFGAEAAISFMGYGKTSNDLSWRFLRGGVVYSGDIGAVVCPVSYNVGEPLPLLSNVWLSPCYQYLDNHGASISVGAQL